MTAGNAVVVNGKIALFFHFSQYQIKVSNIQETEVHGNTVSVTEIANRISHLVTETPELQNIRIQGAVLAVFSAAVSNWALCDVGGPPELQIKCVHQGFIGPPVQVGNNVCVRGSISIYPPQSGYQINISGVDPVTEVSLPTCQCCGCASCSPQGKNQSCPPLQDPEYELCTNCYHESPDREDRVAQAVYAYFYALGGNGFSPEMEFGAGSGRADVVLVNKETQTFAAIAECKGAGYTGAGKAQLDAYLSATSTQLGILANRAAPEQWKFYEEQWQDQFNSITCDQFKEKVKTLTDRERIPQDRSIVNKLKNLFSKENE